MLINLKEHQSLIENYGCTLNGVTNKFKGDNFCGLYYDWEENGKQVLKASYFIGACWLKENQLALQIEPKIQNLDYLTMFLACFKHQKVSKDLSEIYHIDFKQAKIPLEGDSFEITPLLIIHFLQVVKSIAKKGLKKNYYPIRKNLNAKIKGKINIAHTLKTNILTGQNHKTICDYQEFGIDCLENRLLKKALKFVQSYLAKQNINTNENLQQTLAFCLAPFELVSDEIDIERIKNFKTNAFFKEYLAGIKLAKIILKRFAYNIKNTDTKNLTPPFYINMSLLFEQYIYALLLEKNQVIYQQNGNYGQVDFLINDMIVDTKYKPKYRNKKQSEYEYEYKIDDIRQLSGYGRDKKIRNIIKLPENQHAKCLIIYPNKDSCAELPDKLWDNATDITKFIEFKKLGVKLPMTNQPT